MLTLLIVEIFPAKLMTSKKYVLLFVLFLLQLSIAAQDSTTIDSFEVVLSKTSAKPERFKILLSLSDALLYTDLSKACQYGEEAYKLAENMEDKEDILSASLSLAMIYYLMSDLNKAMEYAIEAKGLAEDLNKDIYLAPVDGRHWYNLLRHWKPG